MSEKSQAVKKSAEERKVKSPAKTKAAAGLKKAKPAAKATTKTETPAKAAPKARPAAKAKPAPKPGGRTLAKGSASVKSEGPGPRTTKDKTAAATKVKPAAKAAATKSRAVSPKARTAKAPAEPKAVSPAKSKATAKKAPAKKTAKAAPRDLADIVAAAASEHKAIDPVLLDLSGLSSVADWFFIVSADNPRQMSAIAEKIIRRARDHGYRPLGSEGLGKSGDMWVLVDLGDVVVHIFNLESREMYDLEGLWTDAPRRDLKS